MPGSNPELSGAYPSHCTVYDIPAVINTNTTLLKLLCGTNKLWWYGSIAVRLSVNIDINETAQIYASSILSPAFTEQKVGWSTEKIRKVKHILSLLRLELGFVGCLASIIRT
jgi:hypothetical protein